MGYRHLGAHFNMKCETSVKISLCAYQLSKSPYLRERECRALTANRIALTSQKFRTFLLQTILLFPCCFRLPNPVHSFSHHLRNLQIQITKRFLFSYTPALKYNLIINDKIHDVCAVARRATIHPPQTKIHVRSDIQLREVALLVQPGHVCCSRSQ